MNLSLAPESFLIFGGTGSLGKKLIQRLLPLMQENTKLSVYSRDEAKHWTIRNELQDMPNIKNLNFYVGDIRDQSRVKDVIRQAKPNNIIVAAALKQVDTCELSPAESVATNLLGTLNVIAAVNDFENKAFLKRVLFVSTDKACSPVNVYGMCKATSERVVTSQAYNNSLDDTAPKFICVRYGNVLESRGSIIPLFKHQAEFNDHLTVTDPTMTRFLMTLDDSVDLIVSALKHGNSGETFIPQLKAMYVGDLAEIFSKKYNKPVKYIGLRPGEKMHEDLINTSESVRVRKTPNSELPVYVIAPAFTPPSREAFSYASNDLVMSKDELQLYLEKLEIFKKTLSQFQGVSIEEIMTNRK